MSYIGKSRRRNRTQMETRASEWRQRFLKSCAARPLWQLCLPRALTVGPGHRSRQHLQSAVTALLIKGCWTHPYACVTVSFLAFVFLLSVSTEYFLACIFEATVVLGGLDNAEVIWQALSAHSPCLHQEAVTLEQLLLFYLGVLHSWVAWFWNDSVVHRS